MSKLSGSATTKAVNQLGVVIILIVWFWAALVVSLSGMFYMARGPVIGSVAWSLVALVLLSFWLSSAVRAWVLTVDIRALVLFHLVRFVGVWFLVLYARGELPYAFAVPGGWGDIAAAIGAILVAALCVPVRGRGRWWALLAWNAFGLIDILSVVMSGLRSELAAPGSMRKLTEFPLSLLPMFFVPLIIASHVFIFLRLRALMRERNEIANGH